MPGKRSVRFFAIADSHGDQMDRDVARRAMEARRDFKPHLTIHLGDAFNFAWLRANASANELAEDVIDDFNAGIEFLEELRPDVFLWGNHDARLHIMRERSRVDGAMRALCTQWTQQIMDLGIRLMLPYCSREGVFSVGPLRFIHGYNHGAAATRQAAMTYGRVIMGHVHRSDHLTVPNIDGAECWSVGCLCNTSPDYVRKHTGMLQWRQGWASGTVNLDTGNIQVWNHAEPLIPNLSAERSRNLVDQITPRDGPPESSRPSSTSASSEPRRSSVPSSKRAKRSTSERKR